MIKPSRMTVDKLIRHFRANENMESCRREGKRVRKTETHQNNLNVIAL